MYAFPQFHTTMSLTALWGMLHGPTSPSEANMSQQIMYTDNTSITKLLIPSAFHLFSITFWSVTPGVKSVMSMSAHITLDLSLECIPFEVPVNWSPNAWCHPPDQSMP
jgi:hypothetical protein